MCHNKFRNLFLLMTGFFLASSAGSVYALDPGCQQSTLVAADTVSIIDATTGCAAVNQFGCRIDDAIGFCEVINPDDGTQKFRVESSLDPDTGLAHWRLDDEFTTIKVDTALYGGASGGGNACAQFFEPDVDEATGGHIKSNGATSNITYLWVCSDGLSEYQDSEVAFTGFRSCVADNTAGGTGILDGSTVQCPQAVVDPVTGESTYPKSLVCNFEVDAMEQGTCEGEDCDAISSDFCCFCNYSDEELASQVACDPSLNPENCPEHLIKTGQEVGITIFEGSTCGWSLVGGRKKWVCL